MLQRFLENRVWHVHRKKWLKRGIEMDLFLVTKREQKPQKNRLHFEKIKNVFFLTDSFAVFSKKMQTQFGGIFFGPFFDENHDYNPTKNMSFLPSQTFMAEAPECKFWLSNRRILLRYEVN